NRHQNGLEHSPAKNTTHGVHRLLHHPRQKIRAPSQPSTVNLTLLPDATPRKYQHRGSLLGCQPILSGFCARSCKRRPIDRAMAVSTMLVRIRARRAMHAADAALGFAAKDGQHLDLGPDSLLEDLFRGLIQWNVEAAISGHQIAVALLET